MRLAKIIILFLAMLVAIVCAIKYRKTIKNTAKNIVEKGKGTVRQGKTWLQEAK